MKLQTQTCKWTPGFLRASLDPVSYRVILAEQIQITLKVIYVTVKWEMDYLIFTKQPLTPVNCMRLISALCPQHLSFRFFSDLILSFCFELRCPAGIVNQLPTQTFGLLFHSWLCPNHLISNMSSFVCLFCDSLCLWISLLTQFHCDNQYFYVPIGITCLFMCCL